MVNILNYARSNDIQVAFERAHFLKNQNNYNQIAENLKEKVYGAKIHYYGSRIMGVGTNDSDIDIFLEVGGKFLKSVLFIKSLKKIYV